MSAKRKPLSLSAEKFSTQVISDPVMQAAIAQASVVKVRAGEPLGEGAYTDGGTQTVQRSRAGRVQVVCWVTPEQRTELKVIAARSRRTIDEMLTSMIDALIAEKGE